MGDTLTDPFSREILADPYPTWAALRETAPVCAVPDLGVHLVLRHRDVMEAMARTDDFSNLLTGFFMLDENGRRILVESSGRGSGIDVLATADDPDHAVHRRSVGRPFAVPRMQDVEPVLRGLIGEMLTPALAAGSFEWVGSLSSALPVRAISMLIGLPDADWPQLKHWSDVGIEFLSGYATAERFAECIAAVAEFNVYLGEKLGAALPRVERNGPGDDILDMVAAAVAAGEYDRASGIGLLVQIVGAGADSTTGLVGSCALALATLPDVQARLRRDPERIPAFVEEVLRLESPFRGHFRHVLRDCELAGVALQANDRLLLMWGAANRDPEAFDRPDELDVDRAAPRAHLGFGHGLHHCIGAPLARLEARLSVEELLARTSDVRLDPDGGSPEWVESLFLRRLVYLPLVAEPA